MRIFNKLKPACILVLLLISISFVANAQRPVRVSFQVFYDELQPYGQWFDDPEYGYIWVPDDGPDFYPYASGGYWVVTEYGNTWVSDYPWGWGPFHYGRWGYDSYYGWFWVPGYEWGPAWVNWRTGGGYYGWVPLGPNLNISINYWIFIPQRYIFSSQVYRYRVPRSRAENVYRKSRALNRYYDRTNKRYMDGPRLDDIERATRSRVVVHRIDDMSRPGRSEVDQSTIRIYRPEVNKEDRNTSRPSRVTESRPAGENKRETNDNSRPSRPERGKSDRTERNSGNESKSNRSERPERNREERANPQQGREEVKKEEVKERPQRQERQRVDSENQNERQRSEGRSDRQPSERSSSESGRPKRN